MADTFKDFIPADEDPGALGSGFKDYVPPREPQVVSEAPQVEEAPLVDEPLVPEVDETPIEPVEETPVEEAPKKEKK